MVSRQVPLSAATRSVDDWFVEEILPLEGLLLGVLRRNWRDAQEIPDLRQEIYIRVYEAAANVRPASPVAFLLSTARNLLIDRARRAQVVTIEAVADLDELALLIDELTPERHASARGELRILQLALDAMPERSRDIVQLVRIAGLSQRDVANRFGMTVDAVEKQLARGIRVLADALFSKVDAPLGLLRKRVSREGGEPDA